MSEPDWWYGRTGAWKATLLSPVAALYGAIASRRILNAQPYRSRLPVICIGNLTAGGSGKTPLALLVAKLVAEDGGAPWFLSRGYGGTLQGPVRVEADRHSATDVGDEPLLLTRAFPTVIARDRRQGANAIEKMASDNAVIIMDDGLQNPALAKTLTIAAIDAARGLGNGHVIPAGPLRAPLAVQAPLVQLIVLTGNRTAETEGLVSSLRRLTVVPIVSANTSTQGDATRFHGRRVLAFAGIANPARFFLSLENLGADIVERRVFADHHPFSDSNARALLDDAARLNAHLVTTEKDFVRLSTSSQACAELKRRSETLAIEMTLDDEGLGILRRLLREAIAP